MYARHNGHLATLWGMTVSADQKNGLAVSLSPSCNANPANGVMSACTDNIFSQEMAKVLPVHRQLKILANTAHLH